MNKAQAIEWCKTIVGGWPKEDTDLDVFPKPNKWYWDMRRTPYTTEPVMCLVNTFNSDLIIVEGEVCTVINPVVKIFEETITKLLEIDDDGMKINIIHPNVHKLLVELLPGYKVKVSSAPPFNYGSHIKADYKGVTVIVLEEHEAAMVDFMQSNKDQFNDYMDFIGQDITFDKVMNDLVDI